jgi:hypothetical protein
MFRLVNGLFNLIVIKGREYLDRREFVPSTA